MIKLCCDYLFVWCIWLHFLIMSLTRFRVNPNSIVAWMSRNFLLETSTKPPQYPNNRYFQFLDISEICSLNKFLLFKKQPNAWATRIAYMCKACSARNSLDTFFKSLLPVVKNYKQQKLWRIYKERKKGNTCYNVTMVCF